MQPRVWRPDPQVPIGYLKNADITLVSTTPYGSFADLVSALSPASAYTGQYALFYNSVRGLSFAKSDGIRWFATGAVVGGKYAIATWEEVVAADIPDGNVIYWNPTGRSYVSDQGRLVGADFASLGDLTRVSGIVGSELDESETFGTTNAIETSGGSVTWGGVSGTDYVALRTTAPESTAALQVAVNQTDLSTYLSGFCEVISRSSDVDRGYFIATVYMSLGGSGRNVYLSTDLDLSLFGTTSTPAPNSSISDKATVSVGEGSKWFEAVAVDGVFRLYVDHTLVAFNPTVFASPRQIAIGDISSVGGPGESRWKNLNVWTAP